MHPDILIVDDSTAIRKILRRVLRQTDIPIGVIHEAGDGAEALEVLGAQHVELVMTDINMPRMDGLQLLGEIKSSPRWKHLPVVMVTTEGAESAVAEAVERGAAGYVRKPFSAVQITDTIGGILRRAHV